MKKIVRRLALPARIRDQRGSVLMFAVVMMFLMISFVNILVSSVASRSYFSRKVTTLNEYVNLSENTSTETLKEMRSFMRENVRLVQHYFSNSYFASATPGFNGGKNANEQHWDRMLGSLLGTTEGLSYHNMLHRFYNNNVKDSAKTAKDADLTDTQRQNLESVYEKAARCLFAYLTAARLRYDASATTKKDANYSIVDKYINFLDLANKGYETTKDDGTKEKVIGLESTYFDSQIEPAGFQGDFSKIYKTLTNGMNVETLSAEIALAGDTIGTVSFSTFTRGKSYARKQELGFEAYFQKLEAEVVMPQFSVSKLVQVNYDYIAVIRAEDFSSESWVKEKSWARYPTDEKITAVTLT